MSAMIFTVNQTDMAFLQAQWDGLLSLYTSDQSFKDSSFLLLEEKYSEKSRLYHNAGHVKTLLHLFESRRTPVKDPYAIKFSIWFHDAVYDTRRNDNEERSARLASELLGELRVDVDTIASVRDMILATKAHRGDHLSEDARLFLDLDLAILGMSEKVYKQYSKAIREEYAWVPEPTYRSSRRKILESFIDRENIYFTDEMRKRFEEQARKNIEGEIRAIGTA